jgi:DNA-binding MarR family transcriptional regulator
MLEKRGLARREPHAVDRRVKNVVLTEDGLTLRHKVEAEITARMPWNSALSEDERIQLLALIRKMLAAGALDSAATEDAIHGELASLLVSALNEHAPHANPSSPPLSTGEVNSNVGEP